MDDFIAHVLVVDDDEGIRSLVKKYLNEKKYLVTMEFEQIIRQFLEKGYQFLKIDDKYNFKCIKNKDNLCKIKLKKNKISLHFINNEKKHNLKYELCKENFSIFHLF